MLNYDDVCKYGFEWNHISSKVNVSIAYNSPGMPSLSGEMHVLGMYFSDERDFGGTLFYDKNGNLMDSELDSNANLDWSVIRIYMNTNEKAFKNSSCRDATEAARKTFIHEVGHALKLSHPKLNSNLTGHTYYGGRPQAVMNQDYPGAYNYAVSPTVTEHDKSCLIAKWGA